MCRGSLFHFMRPVWKSVRPSPTTMNSNDSASSRAFDTAASPSRSDPTMASKTENRPSMLKPISQLGWMPSPRGKVRPPRVSG